MADMKIPSSSGGLMSYGEEYNSKFKMSPGAVVLMIILAIGIVFSFRFFFPIA